MVLLVSPFEYFLKYFHSNFELQHTTAHSPLVVQCRRVAGQFITNWFKVQ